MKCSKFSEEQVIYALRQIEAGTPVGDICRQLGVAEATFYVWKKKYAHLGVSELRRLGQLEEENAVEAISRRSLARQTYAVGSLAKKKSEGQSCLLFWLRTVSKWGQRQFTTAGGLIQGWLARHRIT